MIFRRELKIVNHAGMFQAVPIVVFNVLVMIFNNLSKK